MSDGQSGDGKPAVAKEIAVSYSTLHDAANDLKALAPDLDKFKVVDEKRGFHLPTESGTIENTAADVGNGGFGESLAGFYRVWGGPMSDAAGWVKRLQSFFETTADAFMNADAQSAAAINEGAAMSAIIGYPAKMQAYVQALESFSEQNPYTGQYVSTGKMPDMPPPPGNPYSLAAGVSTTYDTGTQDPHPPEPNYTWPQNLPTTETTTANSGGLTFSETTTFGPDKGWGPDGPTQDTNQVINHPDGTVENIATTNNLDRSQYTNQVINHPDGAVETITITVNSDGSATQKDVSVSSSSTTTTTASRANWTAPWVDTTPVTPEGDTTTTGPDLGAPFPN